MGVKERREREKAVTRQRIVDTARELFARDGFEAVSMRQIAEVIEYSPAAIYVHFADKQALFAEIVRADFDSLAASFQRIAKVADPLERIRQAGIAYVRFGVKHPNHYRLMFMATVDPNVVPCDDEPRKGDPTHDAYAFLRHAVLEGLEQSLFREGVTDAELVCQTFWAGVHGVASLAITHSKDPWIKWRALERRIETMVDALLVGLVKPGKFKGGGA